MLKDSNKAEVFLETASSVGEKNMLIKQNREVLFEGFIYWE